MHNPAKSGAEPILIITIAFDTKIYRKAQDKEILRDNARLAEEKVIRVLYTEGIRLNSTLKLVIV